MTAADRRRIWILVTLYGAVLAAWFTFARWVVPAILTGAEHGYANSLLNRAFRDRKLLSPFAATPLEYWHHVSEAVLFAGLLHLAIVVFIVRLGPPTGDPRLSPRRAPEGWTNPVLIVLSFAYLAMTVARGCIQDYYFYIQMWQEIQRGHDPWFYIFGTFGKYPMNAYGPLFNLFAFPALLNPLLPKLLFATAYLGFAIWLVKNRASDSKARSLPWPLLVAWFWMPYCWVEIANFGHFESIVGLFCVAALEARIRQRDIGSGVFLGLGALLKFMPVVLLPFLMIDGRRFRLRLPAAAILTIVLGLGASLLIWGPSTFRPLIFAAERSSHHLSIYRFLKGPYSPLRWLDIVDNLDPAAPFFLAIALFWAWRLVRRRMFEPAPATVLAILVTLMFYQVGFAQYHMVLFVLVSYWMVRDRRPIRETILVWIALASYFGWLSYFNLELAIRDIDDLGMQSWIGLPTFLLGCFLASSIVHTATITPTDSTLPPAISVA